MYKLLLEIKGFVNLDDDDDIKDLGLTIEEVNKKFINEKSIKEIKEDLKTFNEIEAEELNLKIIWEEDNNG